MTWEKTQILQSLCDITSYGASPVGGDLATTFISSDDSLEKIERIREMLRNQKEYELSDWLRTIIEQYRPVYDQKAPNMDR